MRTRIPVAVVGTFLSAVAVAQDPRPVPVPSLVQRATYMAKDAPTPAAMPMLMPTVTPATATAPAERKRTDTQIVVETRLMSTTGGFDTEAMLPTADDKPTSLTEREYRLILDKATNDRRAKVLCAPKLTMLDGQTATMKAGSEMPIIAPQPTSQFIGVRQEITARTGADGKTVVVRVGYEHSDLGGTIGAIDTQSLSLTAEMSSGGVLVFPCGTRKVTTQQVESVPGLSGVPYVNRLFKNVGIRVEREERYLFVTAKVVKCDEPAPVPMPMPVVAQPKPVPPSPVLPAAAVMPVPMPKPLSSGLVAEYRQACAEGRTEDAMRLALKALAEDPKCFAESK